MLNLYFPLPAFNKKVFAVLSAILLFANGCQIKETIVNNPRKTEKNEVSLPFPTLSETAENIIETIVETTTIVCTKKNESLSEPQIKSAVNNDSEILQIINKIRIENNLDSLTNSADLCSIAEIRAREAHILWSHTRPNGLKVDSLFNESGLEWNMIGENLAKHSNQSAEAVVCSWMSSPSHRANILNPKFTQCGIAEYISDDICYVALILSD